MQLLPQQWKSVLPDPLFPDPLHPSAPSALNTFLQKEYEEHRVYPPADLIYSAFTYTSYQEARVLLLGQDPYHGPGQAHGLSFSVQPGIRIPPSLKNIYKELHADTGLAIPKHGCLIPWAQQGVLLLNTVLTVREGKPASHQGYGWEDFTDQVIRRLNERDTPMVFVLWGKHAQSKQELITGGHHLVLTAAHPSPFSAHRGFFGSKPFTRTNEFLQQSGQSPINWALPKELPPNGSA
ncbi:uracil-DNA glycosylase [Marinicrinis sediminis]|uniref:Uracil-DNA glycosylase n=1 Tax=Marinicrinis sediminis TaxID=1652465 RepID=A0ABW5R8X6_9BACL